MRDALKHLKNEIQSSVQTRGIVKASGFTRAVCKNRVILLNFKGYFSGIPREQALLEKIKNPQKNRWKSGYFRASPFTVHLV